MEAQSLHFRSFVHHTVQICGSRVIGQSEAVRMAVHRCYTYNFRFQLLRQKIVSAYNVADVCCNSHVQECMLLLQYKVKPYLGFQNFGCHCKILGCHFEMVVRS